MNLVWFLIIGVISSVTLGEFGQFPFGVTSSSFSLTDLLLALTMIFFLIWQIGVKRELRLPTSFKLLVSFWGIGVISLIISQMFSGGLYLIRFIFYSSIFLPVFYLIKQKLITLEQLLKVLIIPAFLLAALGFIQIIFFPDIKVLTDFGFDPHKNRLVSTFLDPNFTGSFLNIGVVIFAYLYVTQKKRIWAFLIFFLLTAIILTFSRSAYLMLFLEIFILGLLKYRKLLLILILVPIILYLSVPKFAERINGAINLDITATERVESWRKGIEIFKENYLFGVGFNNIRNAFEKNNLLKVFTKDGGNSGAGVDSSFLFVLITTGVIGFLVYIIFWISFIKRFIKKKNKNFNLFIIALIPAIFLNSQFINSLFYPPIMLYLYSLLGAVEADNNER